MEPFSLALGLGLSALGGLMSTGSAQAATQAQKEEVAAQEKAETIRNQAMQFDAMRKRRELIRQGIIARSQSLTTATGQGAEHGSALGGAYGTIAGQEAFAMEGINQNEAFGQGIFNANQEYAQAKIRQLDAQSSGQVGQGLSSLGGTILSNIKNINRIGGYLGA